MPRLSARSRLTGNSADAGHVDNPIHRDPGRKRLGTVLTAMRIATGATIGVTVHCEGQPSISPASCTSRSAARSRRVQPPNRLARARGGH